MFSRLKRWLAARRYERDMDAIRRWEAADTSRLNRSHWRKANDRTINHDLVSDLKTLAARSQYEIANNPNVEGLIKTHAIDVVGERGPKLQVQSTDAKYDLLLEQGWKTWFKKPDVNGILSGVDILRLWIRSLWARGEYVAQIVPADPDVPSESPVTFRLHAIHARRLATPPALIGDPLVALGIRRTRTGRPTAYFIDQQIDSVLYDLSYQYDEIPAAQILHDFLELEPGQVRGVPWLGPALQDIADLRDYDTEVLDAARMAADNAVLLHTEHPDAPYMQAQESVEIERRTISTLPPGWKASQMKPEQPTTSYREFRHERLRNVGRLVNMPLMMVLLDASKHNYSSARLDSQTYQRGNTTTQTRFEERALERLVAMVERDMQLQSKLPLRPRGEVKHVWVWPKAPHVDPGKEAAAETERLKAGTITRTEVCASRGVDYEQVVIQLARERDIRVKHGLEADGSDETDEEAFIRAAERVRLRSALQ